MILGPRPRASIFEPTGASLSSRPGAGRPRSPEKAPSRPVLKRERRGFGRAKAGHPENLFAAGLDRHLAKLVEETAG